MKILLILFLFLAAGHAFAMDITNITAPGASGTGAQNLANWMTSFYAFSLIAGVFLAVGAIVWAGLKYTLAAGNPSTQSDARDQILQALLGLALLFGAYLILYTINPGLTNIAPPTLKSVSGPALPTGGIGTGTVGGWGTGNDVNGQGGQFGGAGASACSGPICQTFQQNGISIKSSAIVDNLQQSTVNGVLSLKQNCGCSVEVTSGTDGTHQTGAYSHSNGYKVDLQLNSGINNFIENSQNFIGIRSDGAPMYNGPGGGIYAKESNHWDVVYKRQ